jgi:hypothetical protein
MNTYPTWTIPNGTVLCLAPGCAARPDQDDEDAPRSPRPAVVGADLCEYHVRRFALLLGDLVGQPGRPGLMQELERSLIRKAGSLPDGEAGVRSSTVRDVGDLWNPAVAAVLYEVRDWAGFLVRVVLRERELALGEWAGLQPHADTKLSLEVIRRHHARWLALYPTLGPAVLVDAIAHRAAALRALQADPVRRVGIRDAFCQVEVGQDDFGIVYECHGRLVGIIRDPKEDPAPSTILCETNPAHRIDRSQWMAHAS